MRGVDSEEGGEDTESEWEHKEFKGLIFMGVHVGDGLRPNWIIGIN